MTTRCARLAPFPALFACLVPGHTPAAAQVLQDGDYVIAANGLAGGGSLYGRFFRLRGQELTLLFESGASGIAFSQPGDIVIDSHRRLVFGAGSCGGNANNSMLLRWDPATGVLSELLCVPYVVGPGGPPPGFPTDILSFYGLNGLHLTRSLQVSIDDDIDGGTPQTGYAESYGFSFAVDRDPGPGPYRHEAFRYAADDGRVEPGITLLLGNAGLGAEMFAASGATYYSAFHGDKIFRAQPDLAIDVRAHATVQGQDVVVTGRLRIAGRNEQVVGSPPPQYPTLDNTAIANITTTCSINGQDVTDNDSPMENGGFRGFGSIDSLGLLDGGIFATQSSVGAGAPWYFNLGPRSPILDPFSCAYYTCTQGYGPYPFSADTPILAYTSVHGGRILGGDDRYPSGRVFAVTPSSFEVLADDPLLMRPRGVVRYPPESPSLDSATLVIRVDSPVNVLVTDAAGRRIGHDAAGNTVNDFGASGAILALGAEGHPRVYAVINPAEGDYAVRAVGAGIGPYTIRGYRADTAAGGSRATITGTAAPGVVEDLAVSLTPGLGISFRRQCPADFNGDGFLDFFDYTAFVDCFEDVACPPGKDADFNHDGFADFFDADAFVEAFEAGC